MTTQAASSLDARDLETLTEGGLAALAGLKVSISQEDFGGTFRGSIEEWKGRAGRDTYGLGFFIEGDRPIGMVLLKRPPQSPKWVSHQAISLHGLKIAEGFQGRGLGRAALGHAIERAQLRWLDAKSMILAVDAENTAAIALYRSFGMSDSGPVFKGRVGLEHRLELALPMQPQDSMIA